MLNARKMFAKLLVGLAMFCAHPLYAGAQTAQFSANNNFGSLAIGQTSQAVTLTATFVAAETIGVPQALTMGVAGQDYAVSGGTCQSGQTYAVGNTCTVAVTFSPVYAGTRNGAVVLQDRSGNIVATAYLQGVGTGPVAGFQIQPNSVRSFPQNVIFPVRGVAVDGAGDIFVGSANQSSFGETMQEVPAGCVQAACVKQLPGKFDGTWGIALDGAGNVFVADVSLTGVITEIPASGGYTTTKTLSGNFGAAQSVAVDGSGNLFLTDFTSGSVKEMTAVSGYETLTTVASGFQRLGGVTLDGSGNVFFIDGANVKEIVAVNGVIPASPTINVLGSSFMSPIDLVLDGSGNLYVTDSNTNHDGVYEVLAAGGYTTVKNFAGGFTAPSGIAIDPASNLYVVDSYADDGFGIGGYFLNILQRSQAPGIAFPTPAPPGSTEGTITDILTNVGNAPLNLSGLTFSNNNFVSDAATTTCTASIVLAPGANCMLGVDFTPQAVGSSINGTLTVTDNSQNFVGSTQQVSLNGQALYTPTMVVSSAPSVALAQTLTVTMTVNAAGGNPVPTGTVMLNAGPANLGPTTLVNGSATFNVPATSMIPGAVPQGAGVLANITLVGNYTPDTPAAAYYVGSTGLASVTVTSTALITPTVTVTPQMPTIASTHPLTLTATVSGGSGNPTPTGSVTLQGWGAYTSTPGTLVNGSASVTIPGGSLPVGTNAALATYVPDNAGSNTYLPASGTDWVTVTAPPTPPSPVTPGFGTLPIGQTSAVTAVTLTFAENTTIGSVGAMTQGAPDLDFALMPGGTCTVGASFTSGQTCTADVTFTPKFAGLRNGGIVALDESGTLQAQSYVHGTGTGPQMIFFAEPYYYDGQGVVTNYPSSDTLVGNGFDHPSVAVDGDGNIFVVDTGNNAIKEIPVGCVENSCQKVIMTGLGVPWSIAVDGAGNLFVANVGWSEVTEIPIGCQTQSCMQLIGSGFNQPYGLALDSSGNVFVADQGDGAIKEVLAAGGYTTVNTLASGLDLPWSVVVDANENLFVGLGGDQCQVFIPGVCTTINTQFVEIPAANDYSQKNVLGNGVFGKPMGLAIDGSGNVFVSDFGDGCPWEFLEGNGYTGASRLCSTTFFESPESIAVDGSGNLYLPDVITGGVERLDYADPPALRFKSPALVGQLDIADGEQSFAVQNSGNAPLTFASIVVSDPSFKIDPATTTCTIATPVSPSSSCFVSVLFDPTTTGLQTATITLTDNNLSQTAATQVIQIAADSLPPAPTILTEPANPSVSNSATFTFSDAQSKVTFECSIDGLAFGACTSGVSYSPISAGQHSFQVRALDTDNFLSPAAVYSWTVTGTAVPPPTITGGPGHIIDVDTAAFNFTDTEGSVTFLCSLDGAVFTTCTSGVNYTGLAEPQPYKSVFLIHSFAVEAEDGSGNISKSTSYEFTFTIDGVEAASTDFGAVPVGQTSAPQTVNFVFNVFQQVPSGGDTIAKINATTLGITGLDYAVSDPGTCATGTAVTSSSTCSMKVTFTPSHAGQRKGGIVLTDAVGNGIGEAYLNGTGTAPQVTFTPYTPVNYTILPPQNNTNPGKNLQTNAVDSTMDGAGNLYVMDAFIASVDGTISQSVGDVWEFPAHCTTPSCIKQFATDDGGASNPLALDLAEGIALDGAGMIYSGGFYLGGGEESTVGKWTSQSCEVNVGFNQQYQRPAVDGWGQTYFIGDGILTLCGGQLGIVGTAATRGKGHAPKFTATKTKPEAGGNTGSFDFSATADSLTVDPQGNIWIADTGNNAVKEVLASSGYAISQVVGSGFSNPASVASDSFGNIFVADAGNGAIKEITASTGYTTILTVGSMYKSATQVYNNLSVDALGNVYVPNWAPSTDGLGVTVKLDFSDAPAIVFPTSTKVGTQDTTDGTMTATVNNSGNAPLAILGLAITGNSFQIDSSATTCSASTTLAMGGSCTVGVFFEPNAVGALTGALTVTDNALNADGATQTFALRGTGFINAATSTPAVTVTPASNSINTTETLSVTVKVAGTNPTPVPTGVVTLSSGSYNLAATTLTGGAATFTVPAGVLAAGSDTLIAIYAPDQAASSKYNDGAGTASVMVAAVAKSTPKVTVMPSPGTITVAQDLSVAVTVLGSGSNPTPTGTVTLLTGGFSSGLVVLSNGGATIPIPARMLAAGTDTLTVNYAPDTTSAANYNNATGSATETVQPIAKTSPALIVTPTPNKVSVKQSLTVIVSLNGGLGNPSPTGTVKLSGAGFTSAAITLRGGTASIPIPAGSLALGTDTLTANYTPDTAGAQTYTNAAGANFVTVSSAASSTALIASATSVNVGTSVTFTATVTPPTGSTTPTGSITYMDGSTTLGTGTLNSAGIATYTTATLTPGQHSVTAVYSGDSNNAGSTSNPVTVTVSLAQTSTALTASATSVNVGANVTFTATVTQNPGSAVPTGTVTFMDGAKTLGKGTLNGLGVATYTTSTLALGQHSVNAVYSGDSGNAGSTSNSLTVTVALEQTSTALIASAISVDVGTSVTFTATVTENPGSGVPTGTVTVMDGATALGTGTLNGKGVATFSTSSLALGAHSVTAVYGGDSNNAGSTSPMVTVTVVQVLSATLMPATLPFPNTTVGTTYSALAATLSNTGNATLSISSITIGGTNPTDFAIASGTNACSATLAANATCSIYVTFTPSAAQAYSATLTVTDNATPTTQSASLTGTGTAAAAPIAKLTPASLSFTATTGTTAAAQSATLSNTGNATLNINSITIAGTNPKNFAIITGSNACGATLAANSTCSVYVTFTPASVASFSARFQISDDASGSPQSTSLSGTGMAPVAASFTISSSTSAQTVQPGGIASYTISATAQDGAFSNPIALTASGLPAGATATFTPSSITPGNSSANSTLSIQTATTTAVSRRSVSWPLAAPALAIVSLLLLPGKRRRRWITIALLLFSAIGAFSALTGCGGGFSLTPPAQTYTIAITGTSGAETQSTTVQLKVQ